MSESKMLLGTVLFLILTFSMAMGMVYFVAGLKP